MLGNDRVERMAEELGGYALTIATEFCVEIKRCVPSVLTLSGSSTPWTWTLVPVNEGVDDGLASAAADMAAVIVATPPN
jgi:hypothetical protein